ncbi:hypothetical protein NEFER03_0553 [Nematocida sp. LUAm3]|nr:hypothetical protein NEFER03_0553 [Nematocida sp. LUAm3]
MGRVVAVFAEERKEIMEVLGRGEFIEEYEEIEEERGKSMFKRIFYLEREKESIEYIVSSMFEETEESLSRVIDCVDAIIFVVDELNVSFIVERLLEREIHKKTIILLKEIDLINENILRSFLLIRNRVKDLRSRGVEVRMGVCSLRYEVLLCFEEITMFFEENMQKMINRKVDQFIEIQDVCRGSDREIKRYLWENKYMWYVDRNSEKYKKSRGISIARDILLSNYNYLSIYNTINEWIDGVSSSILRENNYFIGSSQINREYKVIAMGSNIKPGDTVLYNEYSMRVSSVYKKRKKEEKRERSLFLVEVEDPVSLKAYISSFSNYLPSAHVPVIGTSKEQIDLLRSISLSWPNILISSENNRVSIHSKDPFTLDSFIKTVKPIKKLSNFSYEKVQFTYKKQIKEQSTMYIDINEIRYLLSISSTPPDSSLLFPSLISINFKSFHFHIRKEDKYHISHLYDFINSSISQINLQNLTLPISPIHIHLLSLCPITNKDLNEGLRLNEGVRVCISTKEHLSLHFFSLSYAISQEISHVSLTTLLPLIKNIKKTCSLLSTLNISINLPFSVILKKILIPIKGNLSSYKNISNNHFLANFSIPSSNYPYLLSIIHTISKEYSSRVINISQSQFSVI